jgi:hypothetical protein
MSRAWGHAALAVGITTGLLAVITAPGQAAPAQSRISAARATSSETPGSPTPTVTPGCAARPATVAYRYASPTVLTFRYATPGAPDCPGARATIAVFTTAAGARPVARVTTPAGSTAGSVNLANLNPGTAYYYRVSTGHPSAAGPVQGPVSTQPAGTPPLSVICDVAGGTARVSDRAATSLTFAYSAPSVLGCDLPGHPWLTTRLTIWADPGGTVEVARAAAPAGSTAGVLTVTGLSPGTDYYYRFQVIGAFVQDQTILATRTLGNTPALKETGLG